MKRCLLFCLMVAALLTATACDFYPVIVTVYVTDKDGHDRLDPASEYFIGDNISAIYEGQVYPMQNRYADPATKAYLPYFFGLELRQDRLFGYYLSFGEFDGADDQDISVTFVWPDGTSDTVHTTHTRYTPLLTTNKWKVNGKKASPPITFVK